MPWTSNMRMVVSSSRVLSGPFDECATGSVNALDGISARG